MTMTDFQSANFRLLSREMIAELEDLGKRHGIKFKVEKGTVGSTGGTVTMRVALLDNAKAENAARQRFTAYAKMFDLDPAWFGQKVVLRSTLYKIVDINPRAPKYPVLLERIHDGEGLRCTAWSIKSQLQGRKIAA
mgnify:CR=1 FL=1